MFLKSWLDSFQTIEQNFKCQKDESHVKTTNILNYFIESFLQRGFSKCALPNLFDSRSNPLCDLILESICDTKNKVVFFTKPISHKVMQQFFTFHFEMVQIIPKPKNS